MLIQFIFNGELMHVPITEKQLSDDLHGNDDFWGEFNYKGVAYQIQIYQTKQMCAIFNKDDSTVINMTSYRLLTLQNNSEKVTMKITLVILTDTFMGEFTVTVTRVVTIGEYLLIKGICDELMKYEGADAYMICEIV